MTNPLLAGSASAVALLCAGVSTASAAAIINGNGTFPLAAEVLTTSTEAAERDVRPTNPARDNAQSFQVGTTFQIDAIYIKYESPTSPGYVDGTFNLRIFPVADVNAAGNAAPAATGADLLNIPITLDETARAAASFTSSSSTSSTLVFDLTGTDEIVLPATTGSAGYVIMFDMADTGATAGGFFTWKGGTANPHANGRWFDSTTGLSTQDGTLAITAVPEPGAFAMWVAGAGIAAMARRRRRD